MRLSPDCYEEAKKRIEQENAKAKCTVFKVCGAHIIIEKQGDTGYTERFCFSDDFEKCSHYKYRRS